MNMFNTKNSFFRKFVFSSLLFLLNLSLVFSCSTVIEETKITSDGKLLYTEEATEGLDFYIYENGNLEIEFKVNSNGIDNCYLAGDSGFGDAVFKLTSSSEEKSYTRSVDEDYVILKFIENLDNEDVFYNFPLVSSFELSYEGDISDYTLTFKNDTTSPEVSLVFDESYNSKHIEIQENLKYVIGLNEEYKFSYEATDLDSKLKSVSFSNLGLDTIPFEDGEEQYSNETTLEFSSSQVVSISANDFLDNTNTYEIELTLDSSAPNVNLDNSDFKTIYVPEEKITRAEFEVYYYDETFENLEIEEILENSKLEIDISNLLNDDTIIEPYSCNKDDEDETYIICYYEENIITFEEDVSKEISFILSDFFGNENTQNVNLDISIDLDEPSVLEYYVENNIENNDWLSNNSLNDPENITIYLKFRDDSINSQSDIIPSQSVIADFNELGNSINGERLEDRGRCNYEEGNVECIWEVFDEEEGFNYLENLNDLDGEEIELRVFITDENLNTAEYITNITVDNIFPELKNISYELDDEVFETVQNLQTGFSPRFVMYLNDSNFDYDKNSEEEVVEGLVFANFSKISNENDLKNPEKCKYDEDENYWRCEFENILITSEDSETIYFEIFDKAGNKVREDFDVKIFGVADGYEEIKYKVKSKLYNSIDRNLVYSTDFKIIYNVTIENETDSNYRLLYANMLPNTCTWLNRSQILDLEDGVDVEGELEDIDEIDDTYFALSDEIYPRVIGEGYHIVEDSDDISDEDYRSFFVEFEFLKHENLPDLVNNGIRCNISIVKRDSLKIYAPEEHELNFLVGFTGELEQTIVYRKAEKLYNEIEGNKILEMKSKEFEDAYQIYKDTCEVVTQVNNAISLITKVWTPISWTLHSIPGGSAIAGKIDSFGYGAQGWFSDLVFGTTGGEGTGNIFNTMCQIVTCKYGEFGNNKYSEIFSDFISNFPLCVQLPEELQEIIAEDGESTQ